jgi:hypothetical protein
VHRLLRGAARHLRRVVVGAVAPLAVVRNGVVE